MGWTEAGVLSAIVLGLANLAWLFFTWHRANAASAAIEALQRRQIEAIERMAENFAQQLPVLGQPGEKDPVSVLSGRIEKRQRSHRLVVRNHGPSRALLLNVEVLGQPQVLVGPTGLQGVELMPGEEHSEVLAVTFGTQLPLRVLTQWQDARGTHQREQRLNLP